MKRVTQAGIRGARVAGKYPSYSKVAGAEGVIIAVYYVDDTKNVSKTHVEYDVRDLRSGAIYQNVRRVDSASGIEDGDENVLRPAQKLIGAASPIFDPKINQLSESDGDRVQLQFNYGAQHGVVIAGVISHPKTEYGTKREQGRRRFTTHKGTSVEFAEDGTYTIQRGRTTIVVHGDDDSIEVTHKSGSKMRFLDNGDIDVVPRRVLLLGGNRPAEVDTTFKSTAFMQAFNTFMAAVGTAINTAGSAATPANGTAAQGAVTTALGVFNQAASAFISKIAKVK